MLKDPVFAIPRVAPGLPTVAVKRFSLAEYHRYIDLGLLQAEDRVELLNGWMVAKMPIDPKHCTATRRLAKLFYQILSEESDWVIGGPQPITIPSSQSEPEPDFVIARGPSGRYNRRHPEPQDVLLVIEVSNKSLVFDRDEKFKAYAAAKIPVYWIINLNAQCLEVNTGPVGGRSPSYSKTRIYERGESVELKLSKTEIYQIPVDDLLP